MESAPDYTALIVAIGTLVTTIVTGIIAIIAAVRAGNASVQTLRTNESMGEIKTNVHKLEVNTNSMKDALVAATGDARLAEGRALGVAQERANPQTSATLAAAGAMLQEPAEVKIVNPEPVKVEVAKPAPKK